MARTLESDYYRLAEAKPLPVRWTAPEAVMYKYVLRFQFFFLIALVVLIFPFPYFLKRKYTTQADVWSFGVTVWEVFMQCKVSLASFFLIVLLSSFFLFFLFLFPHSFLAALSFPQTLFPYFQEAPYAGKLNRDVTEFVIKGGRLAKPKQCPDYVYEVLLDCWNIV